MRYDAPVFFLFYCMYLQFPIDLDEQKRRYGPLAKSPKD